MDNNADNSYLAPHPVYFSVDGRPASTSFEIKGKKYRIDWDGHKLSMTEYSKKFFVWHNHAVVDDFSIKGFEYNPGCWGCLAVFSSTCFVWVLVFVLFKKILGL